MFRQTKAIESDTFCLSHLGYLLSCYPAVITFAFDNIIQAPAKHSSSLKPSLNSTMASDVAIKVHMRKNSFWKTFIEEPFLSTFDIVGLSSCGQQRAQTMCSYSMWNTMWPVIHGKHSEGRPCVFSDGWSEKPFLDRWLKALCLWPQPWCWVMFYLWNISSYAPSNTVCQNEFSKTFDSFA